MEPEVLDLQNAVKGVAVLAAIPVVLFALWAEYFGRYLEEVTKKNPKYERGPELSKVRMAGLFAVLFQFTLFLGSSEVRAEYPILANFIFAAAILLQGWIQSTAERKVRVPDTPVPDERLGIAMRAFTWSIVAGLAYASVFMTVMSAFILIAKFSQLSSPWQLSLIAFGAVLGLLAGLGLNLAAGPIQVRKMFPTTPLTDPDVEARLTASFALAGIPAPSYWVIELKSGEAATVLMAGFQSGRGWFRPALFLSRGAMNALTPEELQTVALHEISHLKLQHLKKRFIFSSSLILAFVSLAGFIMISSHLLSAQVETLKFVGLGVVLAGFLVSLRLLQQQNRFHEVESDIFSIEKLGGKLEILASALRKLDRLNASGQENVASQNVAAALSGLGHPLTEKRIRLLENYFSKKTGAEKSASLDQGQGDDRAA